EDGSCYDSGFSITCYCKHIYCNSDLCLNCISTMTPPFSTTQLSSTTIQPTTITSTQRSSSNQPSTPRGGALECFSCIGCSTINNETGVNSSDDFLTCFIAIEPGNLVIRGGSSDFFEDGLCQVMEGTIMCYCTSNRCNSDAAQKFL
ncbi:unnamed protein product, partial [Meganyctiphanes norvegica]